jgi:hypothetical protein
MEDFRSLEVWDLQLGMWDLGVSLFSFISPLWSGQFAPSHTLHLHHDVLPYHRPQSNGDNLPLTETSKTMSQNKPFILYKLIYFGYLLQ